ncbi:hypothetical protein GQ53DRAFT_812895 [Thozetella sp. PMI_491]|nr:hypothetical protein GQ53DRAFT_812895 [Thozetella sp. PMI_491]
MECSRPGRRFMPARQVRKILPRRPKTPCCDPHREQGAPLVTSGGSAAPAELVAKEGGRTSNREAVDYRQASLKGGALEPVLHAKLLSNLFLNGRLVPFTHFADAMQPYMGELVHHYFTLVEADQAPAFCLPETRIGNFWLMDIIALDRLVLHTMLFATQAYLQYKRTHSPSQCMDSTARVHLAKTLQLLREAISTIGQAVSDTACVAIAFLGITAGCLGDGEAARHHTEALFRIVSVRGGPDQMGVLRRKTCRCDIGAAVASGTKPLFYSEDLSWERYSTVSVELADSLGLKALLSYFDSRLTNAWADLRLICTTTCQSQIEDKPTQWSMPAFHDNMISVFYRLLYLSCDKEGLQEGVRLAAMAFSSSIYLQFNGHEFSFARVSEDLQQILAKLPNRYERKSPTMSLTLWMQFMAAVALGTYTGNVQPVLLGIKARVEALGVSSWAAVKDILKQLLWIDSAHDEIGERVYNAAMRVSLISHV